MAEVGRISAQTARKLRKALEPKKAQPTSSGGTCIVQRIDKDGTAWVTLPGATTQTPVNGVRTSEIAVGQTVAYSISNGRLSITGNATEPSVGATHVAETVAPVDKKADDAANAAASAQASADEAATAASRANASADAAQASADAAQESADSAAGYASRALGNLSTVQSVAETLAWITAHGTMALTTDTAPDPTHVYFVADAQGDYTVGGSTYSVVAEPDADDMSSYYELSIDESLNNYVGTHLAVTDEGLWVIPTASGGYKILIATGSGTTYTTAGTYIIDSGGTTVAFFGATTTIGNPTYPHLLLTATKLALAEGNNTETFFVNRYYSYEDLLVEFPAMYYGLVAKINDLYIQPNGFYWETTQNNVKYTPITVTRNKVQIGNGFKAHTLMDGSSLKAIDGDGHTFFEVADLRDDDGLIDQITVRMLTHYPSSSDWTTTIEDATQINSLTDMQGNPITYTTETVSGGIKISFSTASAALSTSVMVGYRGPMTTGESKAYTLGYRASGSDVGIMSLAEGMDVTASGFASHAEGCSSVASGTGAHAEGGWTNGAITEFGGTASGRASHAQNTGTIAASDSQTAIGKYNDNQSANAFEIGNGTADNARSNALAVDWSGNVTAAGIVSAKKSTGTIQLDTTNCTAGTGHNFAWSNGVVATVQIGAFKLKNSLASGSAITVGTVPSGFRPADTVYTASVACLSDTMGGGVSAYVKANGNVTLVNRSGAALGTSVQLVITATYAI